MEANGTSANGTSTSATHNRTLVGYTGFTRSSFFRNNPRSDLFDVKNFHHVEFWCGDATNTSSRFGYGLGMTFVAKSDQGTGNHNCTSHVMRSNNVTFVFTAPSGLGGEKPESKCPMDWYNAEYAHEFLKRHGMAVRALGITVADAAAAFKISTANGGEAVQPPTTLSHPETGTTITISEVKLYGDVVLRFLSGDYKGPFIPGYEPVNGPAVSYGLIRLDHAVGNVHELIPAVDYICGATGFHEFAEFVAEDVGTIDSGLNSMVLASNNEMVLLPVNEPTFGTRRKSQIQTFLDQNEGPGLQHLALKTEDIFTTLREMRSRTAYGGFDFMPQPSDKYYNELPEKIGPVLTAEQYKMCKELGILVDKDDQGVLLQIFTKPLGDRPTVFIEIIQRLCQVKPPEPEAEEVGGCGGFGKGNFSELFKSIEVYETDLGINECKA